MTRLTAVSTLALTLMLAACGGTEPLPPEAGFGPNPQLPPPSSSLLPQVRIAPAVGWPAGQMPTPAPGLRVQAFATGLDHPRWLYGLPNGDILVAESNAPPKPEDKKGGLRGWIQGLIMGQAGATVPSANRIILLRDADGDGVAEVKTVFLENLTSPFGMALVGDRLFVANADAVVAFPYQAGQTRITTAAVKVADLPAGRNHHWTKSLVASPDGSRLYVGVGSNSNIGENGLDEEVDRAAILEIDPATGARRVYASGLRNPVGMDWNAESGRLWVAVNERDELGPDLVPDYMTSVTPGGFYGWPWSYYGQTVDDRVKPARPDKVAQALRPDYALGAHTASLGLTFAEGSLLGAGFANGAFIGQHGSWNRDPRVGYRVIFVPFAAGVPSGMPRDVLTGFLTEQGEAMGRPVGVQFDRTGALLVADDVGNVIWRVSPSL
ncbi:sorbosone dehydrogenase family protein [Brevundimonas sp.]|uniref:PQQ-dependent sugar dehydrogenase n=1 Tax=Brevundimonas sp. TaxID=1871086 RepID=UPI002ABB3C7C|nr:sorbosone dehydrogenase family protein [Brevundimonas sp.]MDZ4364681.1 sorbosone dehydrogenase family protein [Brevundimonas sp.]